MPGEFRPVEPSAYGFNAIRPKTRDERKGEKDKVLLETQRINARVGFEARLHQANAPPNAAMLTSCPTTAAGYISNSDRFHSDTAGEERELRQEIILKKQRAIEFRRNQTMNREEQRWEKIERGRKEFDDRTQRLREEGLACKRNTSNVAYDIVNLHYQQSTAGEEQKYQDDVVRFRAQVRSTNLVVAGDTRAHYNIISGAPRAMPEYPKEYPVAPEPSASTARRGGHHH
jgi:hypothetical protein